MNVSPYLRLSSFVTCSFRLKSFWSVMVLPSLLMRLFCFYTDFGIEYEIVIKPNDTFIDGYCRSVFQIKKFFPVFAATLPPTPLETLCTKGKQRWWQQGGRWQQSPNRPNSPTPTAPPPAPPRKGGERLRTVSALPGRGTPFSALENGVFCARKRCFHCGERVWGIV